MNFSLIIGFISGTLLLIYGILSSGSGTEQVIQSFIDMPSVYITLGGAISATIISVPFRYIKDLPKSAGVLFKGKRNPLEDYIYAFEELAKEARINGMLSLENKLNDIEIDDPFLSYCVMLLVDAMDPHKVKEQIENEMNNIETRHSYAWKVFDTLGSYGPAYGMIGTLIGLINMLANMDGSDPGALGRGMSVALVTTLYGSVLTNFICSPISTRLKVIHDEEITVKELILEGIQAIQEGGSPAYVKEKLSSYISSKERNKLEKKNKVE